MVTVGARLPINLWRKQMIRISIVAAALLLAAPALADGNTMTGGNAMSGELAANESAHEAALTEVMAAEATHTASESEAEALLGATLPITIFRVPEVMDQLKFCQEIGVDRVTFTLPAEKEDKLMPIIDRWAELQRKLNG